ncbi:hypothetical protein ASG43_08315 [Aureimonas sp. Leaf454]|uniref:NUDIX hydrolase n=1 Tax=Aureimonas sp. Leaf454 TaxID=1736381 RepID=UPI0006F8B104|nr:hypothetical protein [Aureimonas sp. Leaf454]KQT48838.1 hypothetical protein ASG43_08315 [Aureimonas sp. Leaf454]
MASVIPSTQITDAAIWRRPPRDAATLILVDTTSARRRILLGRRSESLVFMAGKYVFPGGRVDPSDLKLARSMCEPHPILERLQVKTSRRFGPHRALAVVLAGIRETFEEVGLMIGRPTSPGALLPGGAAWSAFAQAGLAPDMDRIVPVARAITPPGHVRRYDTRFFLVDARAIAHRVPFADRSDRELDSADWFTLDEAFALDLPDITRRVLSDVAARIEDDESLKVDGAMPFYRTRNGSPVRETI